MVPCSICFDSARCRSTEKTRARARQIAVEAHELGDNSQLLQVVLDFPPDGGEPTFSDKKEVDDAMKASEALFARGDFDGAVKGYLGVLKLDPKNYDAALIYRRRLLQAEGI